MVLQREWEYDGNIYICVCVHKRAEYGWNMMEFWWEENGNTAKNYGNMVISTTASQVG